MIFRPRDLIKLLIEKVTFFKIIFAIKLSFNYFFGSAGSNLKFRRSVIVINYNVISTTFVH